MGQFVTPIISALALAVSLITAYLTLFRRGTIRMTQPTIIFFGPDGGPRELDQASNKVFLRTLLYATSKRGRIIECMFVKIRRGETAQNFNIWAYGDNSLARGSGLFVGENGVACNHHFLLPRDGVSYRFQGGDYEVEVIAKLAGDKRHIKLLTVQLKLPDSLASQLVDTRAGVYFDWGPDSQQYHSHVDIKTEPIPPQDLLETFAAFRSPFPVVQETVKPSRPAKGRSKATGEGTSA